MVREAKRTDLKGLLLLYSQLHENSFLQYNTHAETVWDQILSSKICHVIVNEVCGRIVSTCSLMIIPNLTHGQRPYALIENVVTDASFRRRGFSLACLRKAREVAVQQNCYEMMLMAGSQKEEALHLYERAGYSQNEKAALVQRLF